MRFNRSTISLITVLACAIGTLSIISTAQSRPAEVLSNDSETAPSLRYGGDTSTPAEQTKFFSEEFVISATDESGQDFLLDLSLHRKQTGQDQFIHYYIAKLIYGSSQLERSSTLNRHGEKVQVTGFLESYNKIAANDLGSARDYRFSLLLGEYSIDVSLENFTGDFLVRNRLEYSKHASAGKAVLNINGVRLLANAYQSTIYSDDYTKYIYFPGYNSLESNTEFIIVWDEDGDIIVIDSTKVAEENPHYRSHTWVLYKDSASGLSKKSFAADVRFLQNSDSKLTWRIELPEIGGSTLRLRSKIPRLEDKNEGIVEGVLTQNGQNRRVHGLYYHHVYRN